MERRRSTLLSIALAGLALALVGGPIARTFAMPQEGVLARPLTLSPVGAPIPGVGPVGLAVAETAGGRYALIGDHQANRVRSYGLDPATGALTPVATQSVGDGPSALAVTGDRQHVVASHLRGNDVRSLRLDPATGALTPVGNASSGGAGPVSLDVTDDDYIVVANKDSDNLGVLRLDPATGALTPVGSALVGRGPAKVKVSGRSVLVGDAVSNDVHLLRMDRFGALSTIDTASLGARVSGLAIHPGGSLALAGTYPNGDIHSFKIEGDRLLPLAVSPSGGDITDLVFSELGRLYATGINPPSVRAFDVGEDGSAQKVGEVELGGRTSRTLATVQGEQAEYEYVIVNEYNGNQTQVLEARPSP